MTYKKLWSIWGIKIDDHDQGRISRQEYDKPQMSYKYFLRLYLAKLSRIFFSFFFFFFRPCKSSHYSHPNTFSFGVVLIILITKPRSKKKFKNLWDTQFFQLAVELQYKRNLGFSLFAYMFNLTNYSQNEPPPLSRSVHLQRVH